MVRKDIEPKRCSGCLNCNNEVNNGGALLVEIVSEGPHCVPCEYAIAAVEYVSESYAGRIVVKVVETKRPSDARRYLELRAKNGGHLPIPAILINGQLVFDQIPGPEELCEALNNALRDKEEEL